MTDQERRGWTLDDLLPVCGALFALVLISGLLFYWWQQDRDCIQRCAPQRGELARGLIGLTCICAQPGANAKP